MKQQLDMKKCKACGQLLSLRAFYHNSSYTDGYEPRCRACQISDTPIKVGRKGGN